MRNSLRKRLERLATDRWARRSLRTLLRSAWVGLALFCAGLGLQVLLGWQISLASLQALALGCVAIGALLLLRRRMSAHDVARRLDQRFGLNEQLTTALEVSARGEPEGVALRLVEQAGLTTGQVQHLIARRRGFPWSEVGALVAIGLVSLGLFLLIGLQSGTPPLAAEDLPPPVQPPEATEPLQDPPAPQDQAVPQEPQVQAGLVRGIDQQALDALADALRDQSATRPAANALDRGDTAGAAQSLRELADRADELSADTRRNLVEALRDAAVGIEPFDPALSDQVRESAYGLQQEGQSAAQALENLADTVEQLGSGGQQAGGPEQTPPGDAPGQMGQPDMQTGQAGSGGAAGNAPPGDQREKAQPAERLGVDGVPLELESRGEGQTPAEDSAPDAALSGGSGFTPGETAAVDDTTVQTGDDPLRIPADLRDVVQDYFSPTE